MQKCPRYCTMSKKSSNFVKKWTKFQTKAQKCSKVHFIREIWCSNWEIGRFDEKLGDSRENRESWQVCLHNTNYTQSIKSTSFWKCLTLEHFYEKTDHILQCHHWQWRIQGRGPRLIFRPNWGPKGWKNIFLRPGPPYIRVWMTGPSPYLKV